MAQSTSVNPSTALARALIEGLIGAGVRDVVLCPGSRSAPLAYAAWSAERAGHLRLHVRVDERSAGFLALGLAKVSRRPAAVITTSGTAVANLHPAVLEAHHANVPLLVLSADRPARLRGSGANQTTTQPGIFGPAVRAQADLAAPTFEEGGEGSGAQRVLTGLLEAAQSGPVHLNVQFDDPLTPEGGTDWTPALVGRSQDSRSQSPSQTAAGPLSLTPRTLVVLGDVPEVEISRNVLDWAAAQGFPVLAEPFGSHPRPTAVAHGVLVAGVEQFVDDHEPDTLLVIGRPTLSRPITRLLRRPIPAIVLASAGLEITLPGQHVSAATIEQVLASEVTSEIDRQPETSTTNSASAFLTDWLSAGDKVERVVDDAPPLWPTGVAVARLLACALTPGTLLFVGSSNTPRDLDIGVPRFDQHVDVVASRGLAGIDGCVSTAIGIALTTEQPTVAVLGDLTFLHDQGGLLIGPDEPRPDLTFVVVNDGGGGIFSTLEPGESQRAEPFERLFATPTGTDLEALARAHGIPHAVADSPEALASEVASAPRGLRIVEVPLDRATHRAERERLRALAAAALA